MAASLSPVRAYVAGDRKHIVQNVTLDSSYVTGGYSITPAQLGCDISLDFVQCAQGAAGLMFYYNTSTNKLQVFLPTGGSGGGLAAPSVAAPTASNITATASGAAATASGANAVIPSGATAVTSTASQPALTITQPTIAVTQPTIAVTQPTISQPALTAGVGTEVPAGTNLSTVTVQIMAIGKGFAVSTPGS